MISEKLLKVQKLIFVNKVQTLTYEQVVGITTLICQHFQIEYEEVFKKTGIKRILIPRMWSIYFLYHIYELYSTDVTHFFNYKDHTSVLHSKEKIQDEINTYKDSLFLFHFLDTKIKVLLNENGYETKKRKNRTPRKDKKSF